MGLVLAHLVKVWTHGTRLVEHSVSERPDSDFIQGISLSTSFFGLFVAVDTGCHVWAASAVRQLCTPDTPPSSFHVKARGQYIKPSLQQGFQWPLESDLSFQPVACSTKGAFYSLIFSLIENKSMQFHRNCFTAGCGGPQLHSQDLGVVASG